MGDDAMTARAFEPRNSGPSGVSSLRNAHLCPQQNEASPIALWAYATLLEYSSPFLMTADAEYVRSIETNALTTPIT